MNPADPVSLEPRPAIGLAWALLPLLVLVACFVGGALTLGLSTEMLIVSMLVAAAAAGLVAWRQGASWDDIQRSTGEKLASVLPVLLIL